MATLQSILVRLGIDADDFRGGLGRAQKSLAKFRTDLVENRRGIEDFGNALTSIGKTSAIASLAGAAVSLTAALAPASGALLMLPGATLAAAGGFVALKVAFSGFGEALSNLDDPEKFAEAIAKLAPAARETAIAVRDLAPAWRDMTRAVQESAFAGVAAELRPLAETYIPVLQAGLAGIAGEFGRGAKAVMAFLRGAAQVATVESIFASTRTVFANLVDTLQPIVQILLDVGAVGAAVFADLTAGAGAATQRFADFVREARHSGKLREWIEGGLEVLGQFWQLLKNLGSALGGIFGAAHASGATLLTTLIALTGQLAAWANSAEGQAELAAMFDTLNQIFGHLLVILPLVAGAVVSLLGWISTLPGPVQSLITGFLGWSLVIGFLITRFAPLLSLLTTLGGRFLTAATTSGTATNRIVTALGRGIAAAFAWVARMGWLAVSTVARFTLMALGAVLRVTAMTVRVTTQFVLMAARAVAQATIMAVRVGAQFAIMAAIAIARTVATAAVVIAQWVAMAAGAMARAVIMAAAWFVALGPIGWVIAAVIGLVALIIANWDKVKAWTIAAWNAVVAFVVSAWHRLVGAVSGGISRVGSFLSALPGRILGWIGDLGGLLVNVGKNLIQGLIRGIESAVGWLKQKLSWVTNMLPDWKGPMRVDARLLEPTGRVIMRGLVDGIDVGANDVQARLGQVTAAVAATPAPTPASTTRGDELADMQALLARAVREGLSDAELHVGESFGRVAAKVVNHVNRSDARRGR